jgi:hypothetical protein
MVMQKVPFCPRAQLAVGIKKDLFASILRLELRKSAKNWPSNSGKISKKKDIVYIKNICPRKSEMRMVANVSSSMRVVSLRKRRHRFFGTGNSRHPVCHVRFAMPLQVGVIP